VPTARYAGSATGQSVCLAGETVFCDVFHDELVGGLDGDVVAGGDVVRFDVGVLDQLS